MSNRAAAAPPSPGERAVSVSLPGCSLPRWGRLMASLMTSCCWNNASSCQRRLREWSQARWAWQREGVRKEKLALADGGRWGGSVSAPGVWGPVFPQDQMERPCVCDSDILPVVLLDGHDRTAGVLRSSRKRGREGKVQPTGNGPPGEMNPCSGRPVVR